MVDIFNAEKQRTHRAHEKNKNWELLRLSALSVSFVSPFNFFKPFGYIVYGSLFFVRHVIVIFNKFYQ
jgi:hypothetical protein